MVANVARMMGVDCAVMTLEGTGNTWVDFMQSVKALEQSGVSTVQIVHELGGVEGREWPIVDYTPGGRRHRHRRRGRSAIHRAGHEARGRGKSGRVQLQRGLGENV